jgi:hypothetical protein
MPHIRAEMPAASKALKWGCFSELSTRFNRQRIPFE